MSVQDGLPWKYRDVLESIERIVALDGDPLDTMQAVVDELAHEFDHYDWVGIYLVEGSDLVLGPWRGPAATEHVRIPIGAGVCGAAAATGQTEVVPDVREDPRYLECFPSTRSEIVVPIKEGDRVYGEIDADSDETNAFSRQDRLLLERVAALLAPMARSLARPG